MVFSCCISKFRARRLKNRICWADCTVHCALFFVCVCARNIQRRWKFENNSKTYFNTSIYWTEKLNTNKLKSSVIASVFHPFLFVVFSLLCAFILNTCRWPLCSSTLCGIFTMHVLYSVFRYKHINKFMYNIFTLVWWEYISCMWLNWKCNMLSFVYNVDSHG